MNEIVGNVLLTVMLAAMFYFIVAGKLRWGFDTTIAFSLPVVLIFGLAMAGFSAIMAFATVIVGFMLAWIFTQIVPSR